MILPWHGVYVSLSKLINELFAADPTSCNSNYFCLHWMVYKLGCDQNAFSSETATSNSRNYFHGIFPKRQKIFAEKLGKMISIEFLSFEDIEQKIANPQNLEKLMPMIEAHVDNFLKNKLSDEMPFLSLFIGDKTIQSLKKTFMQELETLFPQIMKTYAGHLQEELDLEKIVIEKVSAFSTDKLEDILYQIMSKEFRFVEILGGVIGFIIGIVQVLITYFLPK